MWDNHEQRNGGIIIIICQIRAPHQSNYMNGT